jgi:hypothetical protein
MRAKRLLANLDILKFNDPIGPTPQVFDLKSEAPNFIGIVSQERIH